jgi:hypothetical protein
MPTPLFKKLNLGTHTSIVVLNSPATFEAELGQLEDITIHRTVPKLKGAGFLLAFVTTLAEIEAVAKKLSTMPGDAIAWFCYPKQSSRKYTCEFHRDTGWAAVGSAGWEGVRMVAIDADWSALRFRRQEYIKTMTRADKLKLSDAAKQRKK